MKYGSAVCDLKKKEKEKRKDVGWEEVELSSANVFLI